MPLASMGRKIVEWSSVVGILLYMLLFFYKPWELTFSDLICLTDGTPEPFAFSCSISTPFLCFSLQYCVWHHSAVVTFTCFAT